MIIGLLDCIPTCVHLCLALLISLTMYVVLVVLLYIVVCDPPCVEGACVANDTCNCIVGYMGERCTEPG